MNTNNKELASIKSKIKALASKTVDAGCSEHEVIAAMEMVGRLLSQYNLSMSEIDVRESVCKTIHIKTGRQRRGPIDGCVTALANLVGAKVWFSQSWGQQFNPQKWVKQTSYSFFGQEQDLDLIEYLYGVINSAINAEIDAFKQTDDYKANNRRKSATVSFGHGMSARISQRLVQMRRENDAELARAAELLRENGNGSKFTVVPNPGAKGEVTGTALIVLKGQLIEEEFKNTGLKIRKSYNQRRINDFSAFDRGRHAGNKVNLSRPLGGAGKSAGYLR
jgi:hypothetical protein